MPEKRKDSKGRVLKDGENQRANGTYDYRYTDIHKNRRCIYAKSLTELRKKEEELWRDLADGIDYAAGEMTVADLVDRYMNLKRGLKPNSLRSYNTAVKRIHADPFGQKTIKTVKLSDAKGWFVFLHDSGFKQNTIGIRVFGMTPFGWRCVCALFGILMVPVSYAFMRKISRSTWIASFAALLIVFDFMHFTLSRIGTIDVIVGFFILLTFYLMYLVLDDLKMGCSWKTVCLMILNGMAAGAAMASKWTGVYACAGIAVLFFTFLFQEYGTAAARTRKGMSGQAAISYLAGLSVICIAAYILIPAVIYVASYLSYGNGMGNGNVFQTMWENQQLMLHYHEKTVFEHPYASEWYEWAWIKRPLLDAYTSLKSGKISVVSTFGNPVIWWSAIPALFYTIYLWQIRQDKIAGYLCISYASMLFPWLFIHRTVFIYQYFACSMIQILMLGNCLHFFWERDPKRTRKAALLYLAAVIGAFLLFYPVLSGYPVKQEFAEQWLEWLEGWVLS